MKAHKKKRALLNKIVLEIRYAFGNTYLDRCGRMHNEIIRHSPEWIVNSTNPQGAKLSSVSNQAALTVSPSNLVIALDQKIGHRPLNEEDVAKFRDQVASVVPIVFRILEIEEVLRIGNRYWYLFRCESKKEAEEWLADVYAQEPSLPGIDTDTVEAVQTSIVFRDDDRMCRITLSGLESDTMLDLGAHGELGIKPRSLSKHQREAIQRQFKIKKIADENPTLAAMIDMDYYLEDLAVSDPVRFVATSHEMSQERLRNLGVTK